MSLTINVPSKVPELLHSEISLDENHKLFE